MKAGRELDKTIAEKFLGLPNVRRLNSDDLVYGDGLYGSPVAYYSTCLAAAWQVLDYWKLNPHVLGDVELRRQNGQWKCTLFAPSVQHEAWGETAPEAICLAALKAMGDK